jgi:hypothetical protein
VSTPHVADAEDEFYVLAISPDFCKVGNQVVPCFPMRKLPTEEADYATSVFARSEKILMVDTIVDGVKGNAGEGIKSGVSLANGHVKMLQGDATVLVEGRKAARHDDLCWINGQV